MATRFRVFGRVEIDSWGLKCLGSRIFIWGSLEVSEGKKKIDPTSMPAADPITGMSSSQTALVQSWGLGHSGCNGQLLMFG